MPRLSCANPHLDHSFHTQMVTHASHSWLSSLCRPPNRPDCLVFFLPCLFSVSPFFKPPPREQRLCALTQQQDFDLPPLLHLLLLEDPLDLLVHGDGPLLVLGQAAHAGAAAPAPAARHGSTRLRRESGWLIHNEPRTRHQGTVKSISLSLRAFDGIPGRPGNISLKPQLSGSHARTCAAFARER